MARLRWFGTAVVAAWTLAALISSNPLHAQASSCSGTIEGVVRDVNGQPLAGWMVWLFDGEGRPFGLPYLTSQDGSYTFSGLPCGNYTVYEIINSGWTQVFPSAGGGSHLLNISPSAQVHGGIDFRNRLGTCTAQGDLVDVFSSGFDEGENRVLGLNPSEVDEDWVMTALYDQPSCWGTGPQPTDPSRLVLEPPRPAGSYVGHTAWAPALDNSQWVSSWQSANT
ncbi:MAG: carboxypeptidase-like regulatory domain-containing protein, partial [Thermoanaerobaculia bacterium]